MEFWICNTNKHISSFIYADGFKRPFCSITFILLPYEKQNQNEKKKQMKLVRIYECSQKCSDYHTNEAEVIQLQDIKTLNTRRTQQQQPLHSLNIHIVYVRVCVCCGAEQQKKCNLMHNIQSNQKLYGF